MNLWQRPQYAAFDAVNSSLLSATSKQLCQRAVKDLECCMPRPGPCSGSNVSILDSIFMAMYIHCQ